MGAPITIRIPRWLAAVLALAATALIAAACTNSPPQGVTSELNASAGIEGQFNYAQPLPRFNHSVYRQELTDLEAIQALGMGTTSFFFNQGVPDPVSSCPSVGLPVPNTSQLSNPSQIIPDPNAGSGGGSVVIPNMDPNGTYPPASSSGTYVLCIGASGQKYANYWEGFVDSVSAPARWNTTTHQVTITGAVNMPVCSLTTVNGKRATVCTAPHGTP